MALAIADPAEVEVERDGARVLVPGTWRPPTHRIMPELIDRARAYLIEKLKPAGEAGVRKALSALMLTTIPPATEGMSDETMAAFMAAKASEYQRLLADAPADLLDMAADKCARESQFFPTVAGILKHVTPELEKRKRQRERLAILVDLSNKPAAKPTPPPFVPEPIEVRLRHIIDLWRKFPDHFMASHMKRSAIKAEKQLAAIENREPEEWARDVEPVAVADERYTFICLTCPDQAKCRAEGGCHVDASKRAQREENCPGHVASESDPKICGRCGVHIDELRPPDDEPPLPTEIPEAPELEP